MSKRPAHVAGSPAPLTLAKKRKAQRSVVKEDKVVLEKVLGLTCVNPNLLSACASSECFAYPAGCVAVLSLPRGRQLHVLNPSRKPIASLCLSPDGKYLAIGECGHQPHVRVWDISSSPVQLADLKGHNYGVACVVFSPNMRYLVSMGYHHDMVINVWNWKVGKIAASNKMTAKVYGLAFSEDGKYFVTVGNRRVRFWYFDTLGKSGKGGAPSGHPSLLKGRSAVLGELQDNCFVSVACGRGLLSNSTYTLTKAGTICLFDEKRTLDKFTQVQAGVAHCLTVSEQYLLCGCSDGIIRVFDPFTLDYLTTLPHPHPLGVNVATALDASQFSGENGKFPDTTAMAMDEINKRLAVVYNDHSFYVWDLSNLKQVGKAHSALYHSACVWDISVYPQLPEDSGKGHLPSSTFATCSSDNTVRFWHLESSSKQDQQQLRNIYSRELLRILYSDPDLSHLKDNSRLPGDASAVADASRGIRAVQFHPSGDQLAVGDRLGNLNVYNLEFMDECFQVEAHDSDVLCVEYSPNFEDQEFLATASRDRLIHVFQKTSDSYRHTQTLSHHSASITSIKFTAKDALQLLSCGADKSIMFHTLEKGGEPVFHRSNHIVGKGSIYDMDLDPSGKHMVTTWQDRTLRIYNTATGKQRSVIKPSAGDECSLIKVTLDPSGLYVAATTSDKAVSLFDFYSGECLAKLFGHSEMVTEVKFSRDCKYLYSISADSCIFVWRLGRELTRNMHDRLVELGHSLPPSVQLTPVSR